jgi:hypothetical protein
VRCALGPRKLRKYSKLLGIEFVAGMVRGNTDHHVALADTEGRCYHYWPFDPMVGGSVLEEDLEFRYDFERRCWRARWTDTDAPTDTPASPASP